MLLLTDKNRYVRREEIKAIGRGGGVNILGYHALTRLQNVVFVSMAINGIVLHADP